MLLIYLNSEKCIDLTMMCVFSYVYIQIFQYGTHRKTTVLFFFSSMNFHGRENYNKGTQFPVVLKWSESAKNLQLTFEDCNFEFEKFG